FRLVRAMLLDLRRKRHRSAGRLQFCSGVDTRLASSDAVTMARAVGAQSRKPARPTEALPDLPLIVRTLTLSLATGFCSQYRVHVSISGRRLSSGDSRRTRQVAYRDVL